jgi:DeoR family glycerol-3-phosphate regulon repressor
MTIQTNMPEAKSGSREQQIIDLVRHRGPMDIHDLANQFSVTPQTIRRSVNRLSEQGMLRRVHGGVTLPPAGTNLPWETREVQHIDGKRRIAEAVAAHIPDNASLAIGLGTTPHQVALALRGHKHLQVVTNSLRVVLALAGSEGVALTVAGGLLRAADLDVVGEAASRCFARFKTDYAVFGVGGIDADGTLLDFSRDEVVVREAMCQNCRQSLLVADHSKFGRAAMARGGRLSDIDHFFSDMPPADSFVALLEAARPSVHFSEVAP